MSGGHKGLLVTNLVRRKRAGVVAIGLATVLAMVLVGNIGGRSKRTAIAWVGGGLLTDDVKHSHGYFKEEEEEEEAEPLFRTQGTGHGKLPRYPSPEDRLKQIAAMFRERNLGDENVCAAMKRGEINVDKQKRRGGKKSARMASWKGKKVVVKKNDYESGTFLKQFSKNLFGTWDENHDGHVERKAFFARLANALERMGIYKRDIDNVFHRADRDQDGHLNVKEALKASKALFKSYNGKLAPEALILGENPDLGIFPSYFGHCNTSYIVEFLPLHSLNPMKKSRWPIRAKLALGLLDWARTATEKGFFACDVILGNFAQAADGVIKINDLDQVHSREDVERWRDLSCTPGAKGGGCFDDGHCRMKCMSNGKCPVMPPHHNYKEICSRLFKKKLFLEEPPSRIASDVLRLIKTCANGGSRESFASAKKLAIILRAESANIRNITPPSFGGQVRFGKVLDVRSEDN